MNVYIFFKEDSGSPLVYFNEAINRWYVLGIVSFGHKCADRKYPGKSWFKLHLLLLKILLVVSSFMFIALKSQIFSF